MRYETEPVALIDGGGERRTVRDMTTNTPPFAPSAAAVAQAFTVLRSPLVTFADGVLRLRFAFDADHHWLDADPLAAMLTDDADESVLELDLVAGRAGPPSRFIGRARSWLDVPDAIADRQRWRHMTSAAVDQWDRRTLAGDLDEFAEFLEELITMLHPIAAHYEEQFVEVTRATTGAAGAAANAGDVRAAGDRVGGERAGSVEQVEWVEWVHPCYESLVGQACVIAETIEVTYAGDGTSAGGARLVLTVTGEGRSEEFVVAFPATGDVADLLDVHYNNAEDPEADGPVLAYLESLGEDVVEAALDLAETDETDETLPVYDRKANPTGATVEAEDADVWTLVAAVTVGEHSAA